MGIRGSRRRPGFRAAEAKLMGQVVVEGRLMGWGSGVGSRTTPPPVPRTEARGGRTQWGQPSRSTAVQARGMPELSMAGDRTRPGDSSRSRSTTGCGFPAALPSNRAKEVGPDAHSGSEVGEGMRLVSRGGGSTAPSTAPPPPPAFEEGWLREGRWTGARGWIRGPRNRSAGTRPPAPARAPGGTAGAGQAAGNVRTADRRADGDADADDDHEGQERAGYGQAVSDRRAGDPSTPAHR